MLLAKLLEYHVDMAVFIVIVGLMVWLAHRLVPPDARDTPYPKVYVPALLALVLGAMGAAYFAGENQRDHLARLLQGLAPTFASEMETLGLRRLGPDTPPDDAVYLRIIEAQKRWLAVNPSVSDIYAAVLTPDDRVLLVADSETDYDRDGDYSEPREQRSPIGLELDDAFGEFHAAMLGEHRFGDDPHPDPWGYWVSAFVNMGTNTQGMPLVVGVDHQAVDWLRQILEQRVLMLCLFALIIAGCITFGRGTRLARADVAREREMRERLQAATEAAEAANLAKGAFLASISHEIRTPMNGVLGMLELVRSTPLGAEQREQLDTAFRSGKALLEVLNDVLDYSKAEAGMLRIERVDCNPRELVREVTALLTAIARSKGLTTSIQISAEVPRLVRCDPFRLRQVLNNLMSNAIKFTTQGTIELTIDATRTDPAGRETELRFTVRDSGIGIPRAGQALIFEPFKQGEPSTSRRFGGTGLGLSICKRLVTMMGGQIGVESAEDVGSTFWFTLPVEVVDAGGTGTVEVIAPGGTPAPQPPPAGGAPAATAPPDVRLPAADRSAYSADVLVVEDNEVNQVVTRGMLGRLGYSCEIAADGIQALAKLATRRYRVVLMDMQMPGLDGVEATRRWREQEPDGCHVPIIAMTANVLPGDEETCRSAGMDDFLGKPVHLEELRLKLEQHAAPA
jgi:hypothetical protein